MLLVWELGSGLGHVARLKPIGQALASRGHRVVAAFQAQGAQKIMTDAGISCIGIPSAPPRPSIPHPITHGFCQILANAGFDDAARLTTALLQWNQLLDGVKPDLVILDHSPTVHLALHGRPTLKANIGSGFFCPPPAYPLPIWNSNSVIQQQLIQYERELTATVNRVQVSIARAPLRCLGDLYGGNHATYLATYPELDHFGMRSDQRYWGHWGLNQGIVPIWPECSGPKVFAYLKSFPALETLLSFLSQAKLSTLVFTSGIEAQLTRKYTSASLRFSNEPLNLSLISAQCDLAILNGNHGTTAEMLRAGKPCLLIPLYAEQLLFARRVEHLGAARVALLRQDQKMLLELERLLGNDPCRAHAERFAQRYRGWDSRQLTAEIVDILEQCLREA